jgi:hypothetical protein
MKIALRRKADRGRAPPDAEVSPLPDGPAEVDFTPSDEPTEVDFAAADEPAEVDFAAADEPAEVDLAADGVEVWGGSGRGDGMAGETEDAGAPLAGSESALPRPFESTMGVTVLSVGRKG